MYPYLLNAQGDPHMLTHHEILEEIHICQIRYIQFVPKDPLYSTPPTLVRKDINAMYGDYFNYTIPDGTQCTLAPSD